MKRALASELRKLTSIRTNYLLLAAVVGLALVSVLDPNHDASTFEKPLNEQMFLFFASMMSRIVIVVLGVRAIADEFRYGTVVPTLLITPDRRRMLIAKAIVVAGVGALFALTAWTTAVAAASVVARGDGATLQMDALAFRSLAGTIVAGAAWGVIGLGLGALLRSHIAAIAGSLLWLMGIEEVVRGWLKDFGGYLPGQAGLAAALAPSGRAAVIGIITITSYAIVAMFLGALASRRDIPS